MRQRVVTGLVESLTGTAVLLALKNLRIYRKETYTVEVIYFQTVKYSTASF